MYRDLGGNPHARLQENVIERRTAYAPLVAAWGIKSDNEGVIEHAKDHLKTTEEGMA
jgi:hypothetical protein